MPDVATLGWQIADWVETILRHGPGDVQGEEIVLDQEFFDVLARAYLLNGESGRRVVRRYVLSRAKGRAKSELAGMVVCAEALGPVRFDHWAVAGETSWWGYEFEVGEPVGRPPKYPFIRCLATEEGQAGNTYDNVFVMLSDAQDAGRLSGADVGLTRVFLPGRGEIRPSTAANASKDGGKETFAVFDETHLYVLPELRLMHATIRRNLRKRKAAEPWSLETTTMFEAGAESIAETTWRAKQEGKLGPDVVFDHREGPDPDDGFDWDSDADLQAALAEAYGPAAEWMDLPGIVQEIRDPETLRSDAVRYFLNRPSSIDSDFISLRDWDRLPRAEPLQKHQAVTVGFDGSTSNDSTGIVIVRGSDGATFNGGLWERPVGVREWGIPRLEVRETIRRIMNEYFVVRLYGDPRYWETDLDEWAEEHGSPPVMELPQSPKRLFEAASRMETLVRATLMRADDEASQIAHDGDSDLRRHIGNARRDRVGGRGSAVDTRYKLGKKSPMRKIDLATAATFAHAARGDAIAAGEIILSDVEVQVMLI